MGSPEGHICYSGCCWGDSWGGGAASVRLACSSSFRKCSTSVEERSIVSSTRIRGVAGMGVSGKVIVGNVLLRGLTLGVEGATAGKDTGDLPGSPEGTEALSLNKKWKMRTLVMVQRVASISCTYQCCQMQTASSTPTIGRESTILLWICNFRGGMRQCWEDATGLLLWVHLCLRGRCVPG